MGRVVDKHRLFLDPPPPPTPLLKSILHQSMHFIAFSLYTLSMQVNLYVFDKSHTMKMNFVRVMSLNYLAEMADENIKCAFCLLQFGFTSLTNISCGVPCHVFKYCSLLGAHCNLIFHSCAFVSTKNTIIQVAKTNSIHIFSFAYFPLMCRLYFCFSQWFPLVCRTVRISESFSSIH